MMQCSLAMFHIFNIFHTFLRNVRKCKKAVAYSAILNAVNASWGISNVVRTAHKISPKLNERRTVSLLRKLIGISMGHCIMGLNAKRMDLRHLVNEFYKNCRNKKKE